MQLADHRISTLDAELCALIFRLVYLYKAIYLFYIVIISLFTLIANIILFKCVQLILLFKGMDYTCAHSPKSSLDHVLAGWLTHPALIESSEAIL